MVMVGLGPRPYVHGGGYGACMMVGLGRRPCSHLYEGGVRDMHGRVGTQALQPFASSQFPNGAYGVPSKYPISHTVSCPFLQVIRC